jgi:nicotinate (nicotinamide) nucleotide adenylyltransferase
VAMSHAQGVIIALAVELELIREAIQSTGLSGRPEIRIIKRASLRGERLGVFSSSFNPITTAHLQLMRLAAERFALDELLALAGKANADKLQYDCPLEERIMMVLLALEDVERASVGISSHAYFVDMLCAISAAYSEPKEVYFIMGFDTFERALDRHGKYFRRYHIRFGGAAEALEFLLERSRIIVAGRGRARREQALALASEIPQQLRDRVLYLQLPDALSWRSATEVRQRLRAGLPVSGLVPPKVERYIKERRLYNSEA